MKRSELIEQLKEFFTVEELVCPHTFAKFGERSWQFLNTELLETLLVVRREVLKVPMYVNNWDAGGSFSQRGLRCNVCQLVKEKTLAGKVYLSAHGNGAGVDFDAKGLSAAEARRRIAEAAGRLPHPVRLEDGVSWVHLDVYDAGKGTMVSYFSA